MTFSHEKMFRDLVAQEGITVRFKNEHWWWRVLGKTLCEGYATTLGTSVYFPSREWLEQNYERAWRTVCHELVHIEDYRECKPSALFYVLYAFPHWLALLAILSPILWAWWPLAFLLFLAPWPSPWRRHFEMRAYAMELAVEFWLRSSGIPQAMKQEVVDHFTGPAYYWVWPFKAKVAQDVGRWTKRILCNEMDEAGGVFRRVKLMIKARRS
jgi:hypothetical protein